MPESPREPQSSLKQSLCYLGLGLVLAAGIGAPGCKPKPVDTVPADEVTGSEQAEPADGGADRDTGSDDGPPATEVDDGGFDSQRIDEDDVDRGELSRADVQNIVQEQLRTVFFGYDQSDLSETTRRVLETNAKILSLNPGIDVVVEGHCDERGTIEYNLALAQRRAESVREYLTSLGVEADRLRTISYGEERPVDTGNSESAWSRNRRAAFMVE